MRGTAASSDWRYSPNLHAAGEKGTKRSSIRRSISLGRSRYSNTEEKGRRRGSWDRSMPFREIRSWLRGKRTRWPPPSTTKSDLLPH